MLENGLKIEFVAKDINNKDVNLNDFIGKKIISLIPKLNTGICDIQTGTMKEWAGKYDNISFITISRDAVEIAKEWCGAHGNINAHVLSDLEYGEFGNKYELVKNGMLARGFIILDDDNLIIASKINKIISIKPNYKMIEDFLETI